MNPMSTAVDAAITALHAAVRDALPDVQVIDGPAVEALEDDVIAIGAGDPAALTQRSAPDFGGRCTETGEIICVISCWDGDTDMGPKRRRVTGYLAVIEALLRDDPTIGGAVDDSMIGGTGELKQAQAKGAGAAFGFTVRYEAHI